MAAGLVLSGNARVVWKRLRWVDGLRIAVIQLVVLLVGLVAVAWVLSPSWLDEWDCSDPTADGWVTCTLSHWADDCGYEGRFEYNVKDGPPEDVNLTGVGCNL